MRKGKSQYEERRSERVRCHKIVRRVTRLEEGMERDKNGIDHDK